MIKMPLVIADYAPENPEKKVRDIINEFVFMRRHKKFTIEKP
jgi:hypothetical protein